MSKKEENEKGGGGGGFNKIGAFFKKIVTKAKVMTGDKNAIVQEQLETMTPEEKNRLAAQLATAQLGLDSATQEQVAKAIEHEMERRRKEREQRRKELIVSTQVQLPWGKKRDDASQSNSATASTSEKGDKVDKVKAPPKKHIPKPSLGASVYPIKFEFIKDAKGKKQLNARSAGSADPWDDSSWKPVAVGPIGPSLEDRRKEWLKKNTQQSAKGKASMAPKTVKAAPGSPSSKSTSGSDGGMYGAQPTAIQMDDEAVKEIHAHTLGMMLQNILQQAANSQGKGKAGGGAQQAKSPTSVRSPVSKPSKKPAEMTVDELVELMKKDPEAWDQFTTQNTVVSFGVVTPTKEDEDKGKKLKEAKKESKVTFDEEVEVAKAPVGRDFQFNERCDRSTDKLKK